MTGKKISSDIQVSVLVPIYNTGAFLTPCLESLHAQTLKRSEFILLNDGSTDHSLSLAERFASGDPRFRIISKKNTGYGDTMNLGIQQARGQFIAIVESDDWIDSTMLTTLYDQAVLHQADIAKSDYYLHVAGRDKKQSLLPVSGEQKTLSAAQIEHLLTRPASIWTAIYKRQFLLDNNLFFLDLADHRFQDSSFAFKTLARAHRVYYTNKAFYHYRQHPGQSVVSRAYPTSILKEYAEVERYLREYGCLAEFAAPLTLAKFYGYKWNTARLPWSIARKFVPLIRSDWDKMIQAGIYDTRLYSWQHAFDTFLVRYVPEAFIAKAKLSQWKQL